MTAAHPKLRRKWAFKASMIEDAPDTPGVYALWVNDALLYIGHANGGEDSLRSRLLAHFARASGRLAPTHYSWEICSNPREREAQAIAELTPAQQAPRAQERSAEAPGQDERASA
jgi:hypothetical protein